MKQIENKIMLITYGNTLGANLAELEQNLETYVPEGVISGLHILPFYPASGDRGFAVINYDTVDPALGTWDDIDRLGSKYYLMADFMLNHVSIRCAEFRDYMEKGDASPYRDMFLHWEEFWPQGEPSPEDREKLYCRKPTLPKMDFVRKDGKKVSLWNTFFEEQIDINPYAPATQDYYSRNLKRIASHVPLIRFDAFAYTSKRPGTNCFFVEPEIWEILALSMKPLAESGTCMLAEIHENYKIQLKMAEHGYWVYDFALPMLLLHAIKSGRSDRLIHWLHICPRNQFTTLDTHDGIGVVDVAGLLTEDEIDLVREDVDRITKDAKPYLRFPSMLKTDKGKSRLYQMGCTFYSALRCNDQEYLLARAIQFFTPGIPQVYYVGMLAGENDIEALKRGEEPRSINRHTYTEQELRDVVEKDVVKRLFRLMQFRNSYPAFQGEIQVSPEPEASSENASQLEITWTKEPYRCTLSCDMGTRTFHITYFDPDMNQNCQLQF